MTDPVEIKVDKKFTDQRIKEVMDGQDSFGVPELEQLEPVLKEIITGKARGYIIAVEYKDGIQFVHKYKPSLELVKLVCKGDKWDKLKELYTWKIKTSESNPEPTMWDKYDKKSFEHVLTEMERIEEGS